MRPEEMNDVHFNSGAKEQREIFSLLITQIQLNLRMWIGFWEKKMEEEVPEGKKWKTFNYIKPGIVHAFVETFSLCVFNLIIIFDLFGSLWGIILTIL